jgi:HAE1 family hydrophobic/amphiphilic exporter-1
MARFFINRPIVAIVIAIMMVIIGAVCYASLPTAQFPDIVPPEMLVQATYPGADAETLVQSVATPIEQQMSGVDNANYFYSNSANNGVTQITVDFKVGTNPDIDQVLTQLRVSQAQAQLPAIVSTAGLTVQKSLTSPLMLVGLYSPNGTYDNVFLANYGYINLVDELTRVQGISRVQVFGAGQYAMRIWVKPDQLAKLQVTVPEILTAVETQNTVNPAGQIGAEPIQSGQQFTYTVRAEGRLTTPEQFGNILIRANPDGSTLRLKDMARIELGAQTYNLSSRYNGKPAAILALYQLPGSNAVQAALNVRTRMAELEKRFPADFKYAVSLDTTKAVSAGVKDIEITLLESLALVVLVVYIFLQGWRATLIPLLAVPVSLIGAFVLFPVLGFSINTLSLFGLVLAIGLVVDDAIVVVEAVERHIEEGMTPRDAAFQAMDEVSGPVVAIALILATVFIPTVFIPGITGRLYQQFAVTIAISVLISAFNALSLSPALSALLLKPKKKTRGPVGAFFRWFNRVFGKVTNGYVTFSGLLMRKAFLSVIFLLIVSALIIPVSKKLPSAFLPTEDQGYLFCALQLPDASSLERTSEAAKDVEKTLLATPGIDSVTSVVGFSLLSVSQNTYSAFFFVNLKPWDERKAPNEQLGAILGAVTGGLSKVRAGMAFSFPPPSIPGVGTSGGVTMLLEDRSGADPSFLTENVNKFMAAASKRKEIALVNPGYIPNVPQIYADVDRTQVERQGVNIGDVYSTMQTFMGGYLVNYFNQFGRQWQVYVEAEQDARQQAENMNSFYVSNNKNQMVPLSAVTKIKRISGPEFTMRFNEYRAAQLNIITAPGFSSGQAMTALEEVFSQTMPSQMGFDYMGMSYQEQQANKGVPTWVVFGLSLLFVFLILAALYESWSLPFSVLMSTPIAVFGAFIALWIRDYENDVYTQIGLIMLIGLSAKNAILIVEYAKDEFEKGKTIVDAALTAARIRFRPILMTAFAFILGCIPLWTANGAGAVSRRVLGTAVIGGMLAATMISIFLIPVMFDIVESLSTRFSHKKEKPRPEPVPEPVGEGVI